MRAIIKKALAGLGELVEHIYEAVDGVEALQVLEDAAGGVTFILADWDMPRMNGLDFVREIREKDAYKDLPVLMVTANTQFLHRLKAVDAGATGYVEKPFTTASLLEKITTVWKTGSV